MHLKSCFYKNYFWEKLHEYRMQFLLTFFHVNQMLTAFNEISRKSVFKHGDSAWKSWVVLSAKILVWKALLSRTGKVLWILWKRSLPALVITLHTVLCCRRCCSGCRAWPPSSPPAWAWWATSSASPSSARRWATRQHSSEGGVKRDRTYRYVMNIISIVVLVNIT